MLKIINDITTHLATLSYVERVILFGSRARGDNDNRADIDMAVLCPSATEDQWVEIWSYMDDAPTLYEIDVVRLDTASKDLQENVKKEGIILYECN